MKIKHKTKHTKSLQSRLEIQSPALSLVQTVSISDSDCICCSEYRHRPAAVDRIKSSVVSLDIDMDKLNTLDARLCR